ncbi:MAG TPA: transposase [Syntrophomonadaceae bacterium]|jgi:putative transposase|nr:transposase [Syntrophomonadaceae bacterium]
MARQARIRSKTGVYHIMLRGINKNYICESIAEKEAFMERLFKAKEAANFKLYGYCLMDNHMHLLIGESEEIGISIKRITVAYAHWYNSEFARTGHLFENRFLSEPIESDGYLLNVLRYIHQNPVKAKIVERATEYLWSSYHQYLSAYQDQHTQINAELVKSYFPNGKEFEDFMNTPNDDHYLDDNSTTKYPDRVLREIIQKQIDIQKLKQLPTKERNKLINDWYERTGASIRQLSRVLDLGKTVIEKAIKEAKKA